MRTVCTSQSVLQGLFTCNATCWDSDLDTLNFSRRSFFCFPRVIAAVFAELRTPAAPPPRTLLRACQLPSLDIIALHVRSLKDRSLEY